MIIIHDNIDVVEVVKTIEYMVDNSNQDSKRIRILREVEDEIIKLSVKDLDK